VGTASGSGFSRSGVIVTFLLRVSWPTIRSVYVGGMPAYDDLQGQRLNRGSCMDRRNFIAASSSAILGAMVFGARKSSAATARLSVRATEGGPLVTPNGQFFRVSQKGYPAKAPTSITIDGLVNSPTRFGLEELGALQPVKILSTCECNINSAGGSLIFTTPFEGAPMSALFEKAGVKPGAKSARIETGDEGHEPFLIPLSELRRPGAMLVGKHGSDAVPLEHGSPYTRLFIPGAGAYHHPKWVKRITLVENESKEQMAPPMAGFISPAPPTVRGSMNGVSLTGYAFSAPEPVGKVEVSTDNGQTYQPMPLPPQPDPNLWITWTITWQPPEPGFYVLHVKATSASGRKQDFPGVIAVEVS
jgi:DMSO/TMAO reductase YedYZ molybdopterin-dependent catalytic subunit